MKKNLTPLLILSISFALPIVALVYRTQTSSNELKQNPIEISYKATSPKGLSSGVVLPASCASGWWKLFGSEAHFQINPGKVGNLGDSYRFNRDIIRDDKWYTMCIGSDADRPNDILIPLRSQAEKDAFLKSTFVKKYDIDVRIPGINH